MLIFFRILFDNYEVVGYEVILLVKKISEFFTIRIKESKKEKY